MEPHLSNSVPNKDIADGLLFAVLKVIEQE